MQLTRCPTCHARINLDAICQDESGRELLGLLAGLDTLAGAALVGYLGLFRPATRDLSNDRALRLAREALALGDAVAVTTAMAETTQAMRVKQDEGGFKPLSNHRYLQRVLESVSVRPAGSALMAPRTPLNAAINAPLRPTSKSGMAIEMLSNYPVPDEMPEWFVRTVCGSLAELITLSLENVPAYDTMPIIIERWLKELWPKRKWKKDCRFRGAKSLRRSFISAAESRNRWPTPGDVLGNISKV